MQPFITFREMDESGTLRYYILQREHPHFIGEIRYAPSGIAHAQVPSHDLWICFCGTLQGFVLPARTTVIEELNSVLEKMSVWFHHNRISPNPKKYAKWHLEHL
jgi:hypothetical protein